MSTRVSGKSTRNITIVRRGERSCSGWWQTTRYKWSNGRDGVEVITKGGRLTHEHGNHYGNDRLYVRWTPRKKWVLGGAFGLIVLLAVVLGFVLGSRHKQSATASLTNPQNSTSPSNPSAATPSALPVQHMIAALSFTSNNVNHTRVFFQDSAGQIMEAAYSAIAFLYGKIRWR